MRRVECQLRCMYSPEFSLRLGGGGDDRNTLLCTQATHLLLFGALALEIWVVILCILFRSTARLPLLQRAGRERLVGQI